MGSQTIGGCRPTALTRDIQAYSTMPRYFKEVRMQAYVRTSYIDYYGVHTGIQRWVLVSALRIHDSVNNQAHEISNKSIIFLSF